MSIAHIGRIMVQQGPRQIKTDYSKAYEELKSNVEATERRLEEKEQLLQEYKKGFQN